MPADSILESTGKGTANYKRLPGALRERVGGTLWNAFRDNALTFKEITLLFFLGILMTFFDPKPC